MVKCPECGAGADLTKDGTYAHCASCTYNVTVSLEFNITTQVTDEEARCSGNNIFEPGKEGSGYKGSGSGSGDKEEVKKGEGKKDGEDK